MGEPHDETTRAPTGNKEKPQTRRKNMERWLEVITAIMLGIVAVATAWSGYQSTRWSGAQAAQYVKASGLRVESTRDSTLAGQDRIYDVNLFDEWLTAYTHGDLQLARIFENRFRLEFLPAFDAWLATNPFHNPNAPQGPLFMPQYQLSLAIQADQLEAQASRAFDQGQADNETSDDYVLNTVFLAVVLFLTAIADRFSWLPVRAAVLVFAAGLLLFGLYHLAVYPIR